MSRPSEDDLIARFFAPIAGEGGLGLKDDAALIRPPAGTDLVVSVDALVAGVHFFADDPPASIAAKALGVNLSDLAAKGAKPLGFVLALALPDTWTADWLATFCDGLARLARETGCDLIGGDTVRTPGPLTISVTVFGQVPAGRMVRRTGARATDRLYVSGTIGDAALGLKVRAGDAGAWRLSVRQRDDLLDRYLHPRPRLPLAPVLLAHASGAMDISDGFAGDCAKMLRASGVSARIDLGRVPSSEAARAAFAGDAAALRIALTGGDDYEILASVPAASCAAFEADAARCGVAVTAVGDVRAGEEAPEFVDGDGSAVNLGHASFSHF